MPSRRPAGPLDSAAIERFCERELGSWPVDGRRVLCLIPDGTRTCPLDVVFPVLYRTLAHRAAALEVMVALGTHAPMDDDAIYRRVGIDAARHAREFSRVTFCNHRWRDDDALVEVGRWSAREVEELSEGRLALEVPVEINRRVLDFDCLLVVGPVFPHEVAGFSGGNKYLFPGIAGPRIIDFFHWLGALVTNRATIGVARTLVREVIDRAAAMVDAERRALCMVVGAGGGLHALHFGTPEDAWAAAAADSARLHVVRHPRSYELVVSRCPPMYPDLWTGGKCMYKLEPVVADGGTLVIWAPHVREVSRVHGRVLHEVGYHVRDYFVAQWDRFRHHPWGVLAHSTHVKGDGAFEGGVERPRIRVELATGIAEDVCRAIGLGYRDPAALDEPGLRGREHEGVLYVPRAGETLHRLASRSGP